jgi:hypothetical protein
VSDRRSDALLLIDQTGSDVGKQRLASSTQAHRSNHATLIAHARPNLTSRVTRAMATVPSVAAAAERTRSAIIDRAGHRWSGPGHTATRSLRRRRTTITGDIVAAEAGTPTARNGGHHKMYRYLEATANKSTNDA